MAKHGILDEFVTDNMPFSSEECIQFAGLHTDVWENNMSAKKQVKACSTI